jgi:hypothetical protein
MIRAGDLQQKVPTKVMMVRENQPKSVFFGSTTILDVAYMPLVGEIR